MNWIHRATTRFRCDEGQTLVTFAFFLLVLVLFVGLAIDVGFAFITRASLSKAVDSASLTGARNLSFGMEQAEAMAKAAFSANYPKTGRDVLKPDPIVTFSKDSDNNTLIAVSAMTTINTFFIRVLPQWKTMNVGSSGQAVRTKVVMMLVLDRSGSMGPSGNGGYAALPGAVSDFIENFDENDDRVGLASFASNATTDPDSPYIPIERPFKTDIENAANRWLNPSFLQTLTFADGGLTLARDAFQNVKLGAGESVARVVVFFTDGYANTFQGNFACLYPQPLNFGAADSNNHGYYVDPSTGAVIRCPSNPNCGYSADLDTGAPSACPITSFTSIDGTVKSVSWFNVHDEGRLRALATAHAMRTDAVAPITVFAIGLGNDLDTAFLKSIANDPSSPDFDSNQPEGVAIFAATAGDLQSVFQIIASKILLRLTR